MSTVGGVLESIRESVLFRSFAIAGIDVISTANGKAIGGVFEREDKPANETYTQILHDEGLEPMWATFVSYLLAQLSKTITPFMPEQIVIIPGKLLGEAWHWLITSHQSTDKEHQSKNGDEKQENIPALFWETLVKKPSDLALKLCGLGEKGNDSNFFRYFLSQMGLFALGSFAIRNTEENLPGVNIHEDDSLLKSTLKGIGYTVVEQATYLASQATRFYINYGDEFNKNGGNALAKSVANVVNERALPGHILLGVTSSLSTGILGKYIPRTTAAAFGEFPMSILNRIINARRRRATKYKIQVEIDPETKKPKDSWYVLKGGNHIPNFRFSFSTAYNKFLDICDSMLDSCRNKLVDLVAWTFQGTKSFKKFKEDLVKSFDMKLGSTKDYSAIT